MTTTHDDNATTWRVDDVHRRICNILDQYPATDWTLYEAKAVLATLSAIVRAHQSGQLTEQLIKAAAELQRLAAVMQCRLCDADGWVAGGEDGDPIPCYHQTD